METIWGVFFESVLALLNRCRLYFCNIHIACIEFTDTIAQNAFLRCHDAIKTISFVWNYWWYRRTSFPSQKFSWRQQIHWWRRRWSTTWFTCNRNARHLQSNCSKIIDVAIWQATGLTISSVKIFSDVKDDRQRCKFVITSCVDRELFSSKNIEVLIATSCLKGSSWRTHRIITQSQISFYP